MCRAAAAPEPCAGLLWKLTHGRWIRWHSRYFALEDGCLRWSTSRQELEANVNVSTIDFSLTLCRVKKTNSRVGSPHLIIRPRDGNLWSDEADKQWGAGSAKKLCLDARSDDGQLWYLRMQEHIAHGKRKGFSRSLDIQSCLSRTGKCLALDRVAVNNPIDSDADDAEECVICFDALDDSTVQSSSCGHRFHAYCVHEWTLRSDLCPLCRGRLTCDSHHSKALTPRQRRASDGSRRLTFGATAAEITAAA